MQEITFFYEKIQTNRASKYRRSSTESWITKVRAKNRDAHCYPDHDRCSTTANCICVLHGVVNTFVVVHIHILSIHIIWTSCHCLSPWSESAITTVVSLRKGDLTPIEDSDDNAFQLCILSDRPESSESVH